MCCLTLSRVGEPAMSGIGLGLENHLPILFSANPDGAKDGAKLSTATPSHQLTVTG